MIYFLFACNAEDNFRQFSPAEKLEYLLSNENIVNKTVKTQFKILEGRSSLLYNKF